MVVEENAAPLEDFSVKDLSSLTPRLRSDLRVTYQSFKEEPCYVIEDPFHSQFFRMGLIEYKFISQLNGRRSVARIMQALVHDLGEQALLDHEVLQILEWLAHNNLLDTGRVSAKEREKAALPLSSKLSQVIFLKIPLGNPDFFLRYLLRWSRPFFSLYFLILWLVLFLTAIYTVSKNWERFVAGGSSIIAPDNFLILTIIWLLLKVVHEIWHGLVCKYYEGTVREIGAMLILLMPIGYIDTTSCWGFTNKWHRIFVALAGIYIELFIASICILIWEQVEPGILSQVCYNTAIMASITTIFFNANPLMRFDGYYVLSDWLEEPNFYSRTRSFLVYLWKKYCLGIKVSFPEISWKEQWLFFSYAVAALFWRWGIYLGIIITSSFLFGGWGLIFSALGVISWVVVPLFSSLKYLFLGTKTEKPHFLRVSVILLSTGVLIYSSIYQFTWQQSLSFPAVVLYNRSEVVRAYSPGFIKEIYVKNGDQVDSGTVLARLRNVEAEVRLRSLDLDMSLSKLRMHQYQKTDIRAMQLEQERIVLLEKRRLEEKILLDSLLIRSPVGGFVEAPELDSFVGRYLSTGTPLCTIYQRGNLKLKIAIAQKDMDDFQDLLDKRVSIRMNNGEQTELSAIIKKIAPKVTLDLPHFALAAPFGGSLTVQEMNLGGERKYRLLSPHFLAELNLEKEISSSLKEGQTAWVKIYRKPEFIGKSLFRQIKNWIESRYLGEGF